MKPTVLNINNFSFNKKTQTFEIKAKDIHSISLNSFIIHNPNTGKAFEFVFSYKENKRKKTHLVYLLNRRAVLPAAKFMDKVKRFNYLHAEPTHIKCAIAL
jgi:hypothetical protein